MEVESDVVKVLDLNAVVTALSQSKKGKNILFKERRVMLLCAC